MRPADEMRPDAHSADQPNRRVLRPAVPMVLVLAGLAACAKDPRPMDPNPGKDYAGSCQAASNQDLVGKQGTVLGGRTFQAPFRLIKHGDAVTADHNPARTNVQLDRRDRVERVFCG